MPFIEANRVTLSTPVDGPRQSSATVVDDVSFSVDGGEFVAIVGPSGAGKSTLLHCIAGVDPPSTGTVSLLGTNLADLRPNPRAAFRLRHISSVFQGDNLLSALTCLENVTLPQRLRKERGAPRRGRPIEQGAAEVALARFGLGWAANRLPAALSGGERQRVALARLFATPAEVLLADEPTAALDHGNASLAFDELRRFARGGSAVVAVTHDLTAASHADRTIVLARGRILADERGMTRPQLESWVVGPKPTLGRSS